MLVGPRKLSTNILPTSSSVLGSVLTMNRHHQAKRWNIIRWVSGQSYGSGTIGNIFSFLPIFLAGILESSLGHFTIELIYSKAGWSPRSPIPSFSRQLTFRTQS